MSSQRQPISESAERMRIRKKPMMSTRESIAKVVQEDKKLSSLNTSREVSDKKIPMKLPLISEQESKRNLLEATNSHSNLNELA